MTAAAGSTAWSVDPSTGQAIAEYAYDSPPKIDRACEHSVEAQRAWRETSLGTRADALSAIARELMASREDLASLITAEMGKPLRESRAEVDKSAWVCEYYARTGAQHLERLAIDTEWTESYVQFPPLGVVLAVMPWNYPVWQVMRAAAPAVMAGNTVLLKHASNVTGCALLLRDVVQRAVGETPLLEVVVAHSQDIAALIADDRIAAVTLTGSERAGAAVATVCGRHLKPSVLELGGSDAFIVLADADIASAARAAISGRFLNAGQSCIASKRFIVVDAVADEFEAAFAELARGLVVGDPRDDAVDIGPMARADLRDELAEQLRRGLAEGGRLLAGGRVPLEPGAFFEPTVVGAVTPGGTLTREETFGPLAAVSRVPDESTAVACANDSRYGLSCSLWTADADHARALAPRVEAGSVFINTPSVSDPRMPFGGVKRSGWGRELGPFGIREFVNVQGVTVAPRVRVAA